MLWSAACTQASRSGFCFRNVAALAVVDRGTALVTVPGADAEPACKEALRDWVRPAPPEYDAALGKRCRHGAGIRALGMKSYSQALPATCS